MEDRPPPDGCEKVMRFGCGVVFGGLLILIYSISASFVMEKRFWAFVGVGAVVCGFLAARYGDRFIRAVLKILFSED